MDKEDERFKRLTKDINLLSEIYNLLEKDDEGICGRIKNLKDNGSIYASLDGFVNYYDEMRVLTIEHEQNMKYRKLIEDKINDLKEKAKKENK